jgi:hypothetical protein
MIRIIGNSLKQKQSINNSNNEIDENCANDCRVNENEVSYY